MKKALLFLAAALTMSATVFAQSNFNFGLPKAKQITVTEEFNPNFKHVKTPAHNMSKDTAAVDFVAALSLDTYYGMYGMEVSGLYEFQFQSNQNPFLFVDVMTLDMYHIAGTYSFDSALWAAAPEDTVYASGVLTFEYLCEGANYPVYTITINATEIGGQERTLAIHSNAEVWALDYLYYMYGFDADITLLDAPIPEPTDTIALNIPHAELQETAQAFSFYGYTEDQLFGAQIAVNAPLAPGSFNDDVMVLDYCIIADMTTQTTSTVRSAHAVISAIDGGDGYNVDAYMLCQNAHCYHVTMSYTTPVAEDTIDITLTTDTLYDYSDYDGSYQLTGSTDDEAVYVSVTWYSDAPAPAQFTWDDCDQDYTGIYYYSDQPLSIYSLNGSTIITSTGIKLEAYILCTDNNCYHVTLNYVAPTQSINSVENENIAIYPNPATESINVMADGVKEISIIDANGRVLMSQAQAGTINISNLSKGVYMVRTITNEGMNVQKIVKK